MKKFNHVLTFSFDADVRMETAKGIDMTVPNEAMSIADMLRRAASGLLAQPRQGNFSESPDFDDDDLEKIKVADMVDREERSIHYRERAKEIKAELETQAAKSKAAAEAKALEDEEIRKEFRATRDKAKAAKGGAGLKSKPARDEV